VTIMREFKSLFVKIQAKEDLKEVTHKVYFDVEIDGKSAGMIR